MKIEDMNIGDLRPYEFNNRKHDKKQVDRIAKSIKEFGFNQPIVIDENNEILVGHGRLLAAQVLKLETVPVLKREGLSEKEKRAYRILDNKLQNDSTWYFDNLNLELDWLEDSDFDLGEWGLDELRINNDEIEVIEDNFDDTPQESDTIIIKQGDLIELGRHRLLCGDSTDSDDVSELLLGEKPVLMVTDPPYGVEYDPSWREKCGVSRNRAKMGKVQNDHRTDWGDAYLNIAAQVCYVWHNGRYAKEFQSSLEGAGYEIVCQIIWNKERFALGRGDYHWKHEPCWYAVKKGQKHNWQGARDQSTVWDINAREDGGHGHGTQKPIDCMGIPIKNNSTKGDLVCDPFLGSGTTLIACEQLNRTCYGIEIEPKYCQVVINRYLNQVPGSDIIINGEKLTAEEWREATRPAEKAA